MHQKLFIHGTLFLCMLNISNTQKNIIFRKLQCTMRSNKIDKIDCILEDTSAIMVQITTNNIEVMSLVGLSDLKLHRYGRSKPVYFKGFRLEICKVLTSVMRPSLMTFIYKGILGADHNLPAKCPFARNTTYVLRHITFNTNYLPFAVSEVNFTFNSKFWGNNVNIFEMNIEGSFCNTNHDCTGFPNIT